MYNMYNFSSSSYRNMGDVQLVTSSSLSRNRLTSEKVSLSNEAPAFTLPPKNARVCLGGMARLEGKVQSHTYTDILPVTRCNPQTKATQYCTDGFRCNLGSLAV